MQTTTTHKPNRSWIMKLACDFSQLGHTQSDAQKRAWEIWRLKCAMLDANDQETTVEFVYEKVDKETGELVERHASGKIFSMDHDAGATKQLAIRYYDESVANENKWRRFRADRFKYAIGVDLQTKAA